MIKKTLTISILLCGLLSQARGIDEVDFSPSRKLSTAQYIIENFYVDDVNSDSIVSEGIIAMLKTLDPHSAYSTPQETKELNEPLEGKFSGIGVQFNMSTDTVYVIQPVPGGPSERVGIRPGDRIIWADDSLLAGRKLPNSRIIKILRGDKGTKVNLKVKRGNDPELIDFVVTRDDIPIYSVDGAYMVTPDIGYVRLTRFAEDSGKEMAEAIEKLKKQGMKSLIIDLEDNGGGYLGAAYEVASLLLPDGAPVVSTKGRRTEPHIYFAENHQPLFSGPVAVLVNQYSASAAEILSGALQDNDRGVVIGRRTFGKGLVQRPFPFPDGSMIRLTIAHYYTPSGRSIQKPYEKGKGEEYRLDMLNRYESGELWSADSIHFDETQKYQTLRHGRTVYGGGGIMPDVFVPVDTAYYTPYYRDLMAKATIAQYCLHYVDSHRADIVKKYPTENDFYANFTVSPEIIDELVERAKADGIEPNPEQLDTSRPVIEAIIRGLLARDLYENGTYVRSTNPLNPVFNKAVELLSDPARYYILLNPAK